MNELDKDGYITHRLYRQHTGQTNNGFIKDLSKLGRDLDKMIIIDNVKENFQLQEENGLHIKHFLGDEKDDELNILCPELIGNI